MRPKAFPRRRNGVTVRSPRREPCRTCVWRGPDGWETGALPRHRAHNLRPAAKGCQLQPQASCLLERTRSGAVLDPRFGSLRLPNRPVHVRVAIKNRVIAAQRQAESRYRLPTELQNLVIRGALSEQDYQSVFNQARCDSALLSLFLFATCLHRNTPSVF